MTQQPGEGNPTTDEKPAEERGTEPSETEAPQVEVNQDVNVEPQGQPEQEN